MPIPTRECTKTEDGRGGALRCGDTVRRLYLTTPQGPAGDPNKVLTIKLGSRVSLGQPATTWLTTAPRESGSSRPGAVRWELPPSHSADLQRDSTRRQRAAKAAAAQRRVQEAAARQAAEKAERDARAARERAALQAAYKTTAKQQGRKEDAAAALRKFARKQR